MKIKLIALLMTVFLLVGSMPVLAEETVPPQVDVPTIKNTTNLPNLSDFVVPSTDDDDDEPGNSGNPTAPATTEATTEATTGSTTEASSPDAINETIEKFDASGSFKTALDKMGTVDVLTIKGDVNLSFNKAALEKIGVVGTLELTAKPVAVDSLSAAAQAKVGDRPVFEFSLKLSGKAINSFGNGKVTVEIPYVLKAGENPNAILIYYIDEKGHLKTVKSKYENGLVTFITNHFSKYAVGYNNVQFKDVDDTSWYADEVTYLSGREIMNGKEADTFAPKNMITRGEVIAILANLADADLSTYKASTFTDVKNTDWFMPSIQWGLANGIIGGKGNQTFKPNDAITRQDLSVLIYKYAGQIEAFTLPKNNTEIAFKDKDKVQKYAEASVIAMQRAGFINGKPQNMFDPTGQATRAEVAVIITALIKAMVQ